MPVMGMYSRSWDAHLALNSFHRAGKVFFLARSPLAPRTTMLRHKSSGTPSTASSRWDGLLILLDLRGPIEVIGNWGMNPKLVASLYCSPLASRGFTRSTSSPLEGPPGGAAKLPSSARRKTTKSSAGEP